MFGEVGFDDYELSEVDLVVLEFEGEGVGEEVEFCQFC